MKRYIPTIITHLTCAMMLVSCGAPPPVVVKDPVTVDVPVTVPCIKGDRPAEVTPVKGAVTRAQWDAMTTDQREKLLEANSLSRKSYSDVLYVVTAGCQ